MRRTTIGENGRVESTLLVLIAALAAAAPRLLARISILRRTPVAAVALWQSVSTTALIAGLAAAPVAVWQALTDRADPTPSHQVVLVAAIAVTGLFLYRLLLVGHRIGTSLRQARERHREMIDLIGPGRRPAQVGDAEGQGLRILPHPTVTAYCLPGRRARVVLTDGTVESLTPAELDAVLQHERAHLRYRHDLILEFFTVVHSSLPAVMRAHAGLTEVRLLLELSADRFALRTHRPRELGVALVALAQARDPGVGMAAGGDPGAAGARIAELRRPGPYRLQATLVLTLATVLPLIPLAVIWFAVS